MGALATIGSIPGSQRLAPLVQGAIGLVATHLAKTTTANYNRIMSDFHYFITALHPTFVSFPANPAHILLYVTHLFNLGLSHSTVVSRVSALSFFYKLHSLPDPTTHFLVTRSLCSFKKASPSYDSRLPITLQILHSMITKLQILSPTSYHFALYKSMLLTSFYAFLRPGEMTSSDNNLQFFQLKLFIDHFQLTFYKFKHYCGDPIFINIFAQNSMFCPFKAMFQYLNVRGTKPGALFCQISGKPVTYSEYSVVFSRIIQFLQIPGKYSPHSARIGAATHAAIMGIPEQTIRRLGRWHSDSYLRYIRISSFNVTS